MASQNMQTMNNLTTTFSLEEREVLQRAHRHLEHPSLAARLTSVVGTPMEMALHLLPKPWYDSLHGAAEDGIRKALDMAVSSLARETGTTARDHWHKLLSMGTGAVGGFFGLPALLVELPISTAIMLRSIADIARSEGEPVESLETQLACMEVFALGGRSKEDDAADTGYYGIRAALALSVSEATKHIAKKGLTDEGAPALTRFAAMLASRFGMTVSEKVAAQIVPVVGAAGGALINAIFMQHFQDMARSHFTVRRLERKYGPHVVRAEYERLSLA